MMHDDTVTTCVCVCVCVCVAFAGKDAAPSRVPSLPSLVLPPTHPALLKVQTQRLVRVLQERARQERVAQVRLLSLFSYYSRSSHPSVRVCHC
ncbi:MAG: hypothetical protein P4L40_19420 [Terracidiphilus sp.]|nr:hypothetical protein [Terracidiphilus sp.]